MTDALLRVAVVTPVRNGGGLLAETVSSVLSQSAVRTGRVRLDYVIVDGASTDSSVAQATAAAAGDEQVRLISEPDRGMYDALAKGFALAEGDVYCYLNAGDLWMPWALDVVLDVLQQRPDVSWLCGYYGGFNAAGQMTEASLPFRFRRRLITCGAYDGTRLPMVQQETTFWRSGLMSTVDLDALRAHQLAGDAYLWNRFAAVAELHVVKAVLGGWRAHGAHLGGNLASYREELRRLSRPVGAAWRLGALTERLFWSLPRGLRSKLAGRLLVQQGSDMHWR